MCGSCELMRLQDPNRAGSCGVSTICWCSSQLTLHLPLGLRRATAGCTGTPSRHHVTRDVRSCMVGAQAVGSQIQAMFETWNMFLFLKVLGVIYWVGPVAQHRTSCPTKEMTVVRCCGCRLQHGKFEVLFGGVSLLFVQWPVGVGDNISIACLWSSSRVLSKRQENGQRWAVPLAATRTPIRWHRSGGGHQFFAACVCLFQGQSGRSDDQVYLRVFLNSLAMNVVSLLGLCGLSTDIKYVQRAKVCAPRTDPCVARLVGKVFR